MGLALGNLGKGPGVTPCMIPLAAALALFQGRPEPDWLPVLDAPKGLTHELTIPAPAHPGQKLELRGKVLRAEGRTPVAGVILYFHHTDARGIYPRPDAARSSDFRYWHGALRGWLKTDSGGNYVLKTTRPAPYPGRTDPAHIHVYGLLPGSRTGFYFADFVFAGDPLLTDRYWRSVRANNLEPYGGVALSQDSNGVLQGRRDLILKN